MAENQWELDDFHVLEDELAFNGVDVDTGSYLFPRTRLDRLTGVIRGQEPDRAHLADLTVRQRVDEVDHLAVVFGRRPERLDQVGWALVTADDVGPDVIDALAPLRDLRRGQAKELYRELTGPADGVHADESNQRFLIRHRVDPNDVADPRQLPYYVLLVGSPARIPFSLQYQLGVQRAVGRLDFDSPGEYATYAENVVAAETHPPAAGARRVHVFATRNPGDLPTALSASRLAQPLIQHLEGMTDVGSDIGETATKRRLSDLLHGDERLDLLFTATHGLGSAGPGQREIQGALLCQDWAGPLRDAGPLTGAEYYGGDDLEAGRPVTATIMFSFGCYSAGTPRTTDFVDDPTSAASADPPFVARLAQRLLTHPGGGCLGFVGHVDRAWNCSFLWEGIEPRILPFSSSIDALLAGAPLGMAMEYVSARYATTAAELVDLLHQERAWGRSADERELARLWLAANDARNFLIVGDPAVRIPTAGFGIPDD